jgi:hypothetical protein
MHRFSMALLSWAWSAAIIMGIVGVGCASTEPYDRIVPVQSSIVGTWALVEYKEYAYYDEERNEPTVHRIYDEPLTLVDIAPETLTTYTWTGGCYELTILDYRLVNTGGETGLTDEGAEWSGSEEGVGGVTRWATFVQKDDEQLVLHRIQTTTTADYSFSEEHIYTFQLYDDEIPPTDWPDEPCD